MRVQIVNSPSRLPLAVHSPKKTSPSRRNLSPKKTSPFRAPLAHPARKRKYKTRKKQLFTKRKSLVRNQLQLSQVVNIECSCGDCHGAWWQFHGLVKVVSWYPLQRSFSAAAEPFVFKLQRWPHIVSATGVTHILVLIVFIYPEPEIHRHLVVVSSIMAQLDCVASRDSLYQPSSGSALHSSCRWCCTALKCGL